MVKPGRELGPVSCKPNCDAEVARVCHTILCEGFAGCPLQGTLQRAHVGFVQRLSYAPLTQQQHRHAKPMASFFHLCTVLPTHGMEQRHDDDEWFLGCVFVEQFTFPSNHLISRSRVEVVCHPFSQTSTRMFGQSFTHDSSCGQSFEYELCHPRPTLYCGGELQGDSLDSSFKGRILQEVSSKLKTLEASTDNACIIYTTFKTKFSVRSAAVARSSSKDPCGTVFL
eukprot:3784903-Amphidinium_carterae.1